MRTQAAVLVVMLIAGRCFGAAVEAPPRTLLHLSFEDESWVAFSRSQSRALVDYPDLVAGRKGKAASIMKRGEFGSIELAGNLDKARGTLSFWYKPAFPDRKGAAYVLVSSGGSGKHARNILRIWVWNHRIRFDITRTQGRRSYCVSRITDWEAGRWVHIAGTWDNTSGIALCVDGKKTAESSVTWAPVDTKQLIIGSLNTSGSGRYGPAGAVIDELKVYDAVLSAEQVAADYHGTLGAPNAAVQPRSRKPEVAKALTFHASFDRGLDADRAAGSPKTLGSREAALVPGYEGKGVALPRDGSVTYDAVGNMARERGTVSVWLKLDWEPRGNGFPISKVGDRANGEAHAVLTVAGAGRAAVSPFRLELSNFLRLRWTGNGGLWLPLNRQILTGSWHQYALTWNAEKRLARAYLDGAAIHASARLDPGAHDFVRLVLGAACGIAGLDGVLDELRIYNYAMEDAEVAEHYERDVGVAVVVLDRAAVRGRPNTLRIKRVNRGAEPASGDFRVRIRDGEGRVLGSADLGGPVPPRQSVISTVEFTPTATGLYSVHVFQGDRLMEAVQGFAVDPEPVRIGRAVIARDEPDSRQLLTHLDCAEKHGEDVYRDDGECRVIRNSIGAYREARTPAASGFAYRFMTIEQSGRPHWLEIDYPDDKPRTFFVGVFQEKDGHVDAKGLDTIGVITGVHHPLTMRMQRKRLLFWPDSRNIVVGCYSYRQYPDQAGPALAAIRLYLQRGPLPVRKATRFERYPERRIGVWQEDPTMPAYAWFNQDTMHDAIDLGFWHTKWTRSIEYLNYSGQNLWNMLLFDYDGDTALDTHLLAPSWRASSHGRVPGWADLGAMMLDREEIDFFAAVNPRIAMRGLRGGFGKMIDSEHRRGADNMRSVSAGGAALVECIGADDYYAPCYNPLHPVVQDAYARIVRLYTEKFGKYAHFKGVHFLTTEASSLYFHSLEQGYGDYSIALFENDTGIRVPVSAHEPRRYSQRHAWLMANAREPWVTWRTRKILEFYRRLSEIVRRGDPSRRLCISLRGGKTLVKHQERWPLDDASLTEYWRECGLDLRLFEQEPGIALMPALVPNRGRIYGEGRKRGGRDEYNWRGSSFQEELPAALRRFHERWAMVSYHNNLEVLPHTRQRIPSYWWAFGSWAGRINGPMHCFSTPHPSEEYVLEHLVHVLAGSDPQRIIHGWWGCPDNGHLAAFSRFYSAFRSIPAVDFTDVPRADDPVKVRYYLGKGESFLYLVNRAPYPVQCSLHVSGVTRFTQTRSGEVFTLAPDGPRSRLDIMLTPFDVVCLRGTGAVTIYEIAGTVPEAVAGDLSRELGLSAAIVEAEGNDGSDVAAAQLVLRQAREALAAGHYARLRHLLQSGPVLRLRMRQRIGM